MSKVRRTITFSTELDEAMSMLAASKNMSYSEFLESRLRTVSLIQQMIGKLEELPEMPVVNTDQLKVHGDEPLQVIS